MNSPEKIKVGSKVYDKNLNIIEREHYLLSEKNPYPLGFQIYYLNLLS